MYFLVLYRYILPRDGDIMDKLKEFFNKWIKFKPDEASVAELDVLNITIVSRVCFVMSILQFLLFFIYAALNFNNLFEIGVRSELISFLGNSLICVAGALISWKMTGKKNNRCEHSGVVTTFITLYSGFLLLWEIFVSVNSFLKDGNIFPFLSASLCVAVLVKLRPAVSIALNTSTFLALYLILNFFVKPGAVNLHHYAMFWLLLTSGSIINYRLTINYIIQKNRTKILNESLELIANHDSLTRLQNRYAFNQRIPDFLGAEIFIAISDVNEFKKINDTFGHGIGDDVLRLVAETIREIFRSDSAFRFGGDEFLIIETAFECPDFEEKIKRINQRLAKQRINNSDHVISMSFGIVKSRAEAPQDLLELIASADKKLYDEKKLRKLKR